jgi:hypothetical protein
MSSARYLLCVCQRMLQVVKLLQRSRSPHQRLQEDQEQQQQYVHKWKMHAA